MLLPTLNSLDFTRSLISLIDERVLETERERLPCSSPIAFLLLFLPMVTEEEKRRANELDSLYLALLAFPHSLNMITGEMSVVDILLAYSPSIDCISLLQSLCKEKVDYFAHYLYYPYLNFFLDL